MLPCPYCYGWDELLLHTPPLDHPGPPEVRTLCSQHQPLPRPTGRTR